MGNFYTNATLRTTERQAVIEPMRAQGRMASFRQPLASSQPCTTAWCGQQDVRDLEALASDLSSQFYYAALAVLNHHDDVLWIGLARNGEWVTTYQSNQVLSRSALRLARKLAFPDCFRLSGSSWDGPPCCLRFGDTAPARLSIRSLREPNDGAYWKCNLAAYC